MFLSQLLFHLCSKVRVEVQHGVFSAVLQLYRLEFELMSSSFIVYGSFLFTAIDLTAKIQNHLQVWVS